MILLEVHIETVIDAFVLHLDLASIKVLRRWKHLVVALFLGLNLLGLLLLVIKS